MSVKQEEVKAEDLYEDDVSLSPSSPRPIKEDPKSAEDDGGVEDDNYDDTQDLDTSDSHSKVWLVRMPKFLMSELRKGIDRGLGGKEIGKVQLPANATGGQGQVRVMLNQDIPEIQDLPHRYDLTITHPEVESTFVFTERDVPRKRASDDESTTSKPVKKTALTGKVGHEFTLTPDFNDPNYRTVIRQRREMEHAQPERQTTLLETPSGATGMRYGATLRQQRENWARPYQRRQQARVNTEGKATRMASTDLLDALNTLFDEQPYWTLKALRDRLNQPEVYLREMLEKIAVLNKRGPYAMKYSRREEFRAVPSGGLASLVSGEEDFKDEEDDFDDSDAEMENVAL